MCSSFFLNGLFWYYKNLKVCVSVYRTKLWDVAPLFDFASGITVGDGSKLLLLATLNRRFLRDVIKHEPSLWTKRLTLLCRFENTSSGPWRWCWKQFFHFHLYILTKALFLPELKKKEHFLKWGQRDTILCSGPSRSYNYYTGQLAGLCRWLRL